MTNIMKSSYKNYCHVCGSTFSLTSSKKICHSCQLPVCKDHASNSSPYICDFCYKENLLINYQFSNKDLRDQLKFELLDITSQNQTTKISLQESEIKLKHYQGVLKNTQEKIKSLKTMYEEKISKEIERNNIFQENYNNLKKSTDEIAFGEEALKKKIESVNGQIDEIKGKISKSKEKKIGLDEEIGGLREKVRMYIPLKGIKTSICKICLHKVEYIYRSTAEGSVVKDIVITNKPCCCMVI